MTRLAVLADVHGNLPALHAVVDDMASFNVDHVIVAGDMVNWGPFSAEVMDYILARHWSMIRGNNEYYVLDYQSDRSPEKWKHFTMPPWLYSQLKGHLFHVLAGLPDEIQLRFPDAPPVRVCHGLPGNPWETVFWDTPEDEIRAALADVNETTYICAHSHIALDRQVDSWHILNPGSVGAPLDCNPDASYMILDGDSSGWRAMFRRVPLDYSSVLAAFEQQNFYEQVGPIAHLIIEEFKTARLQVYPFRRWMEQTYPDESDTIERIEEFLSIDPQPYIPEYYWLDNILRYTSQMVNGDNS